MAETNEITLDVECGGEGGASVIVSGVTNVMGETLLTVKNAFFDTTRVGVWTEATVPPGGIEVIEEVVDDAITKGRGDNLAGDGIVDDEGDASARFVYTANNTIAK